MCDEEEINRFVIWYYDNIRAQDTHKIPIITHPPDLEPLLSDDEPTEMPDVI